MADTSHGLNHDESLLDESSVLTETPEFDAEAELVEESSPAEPQGDPCPNCQEPTFVPGAQWCSRCGFYPRLNIFVEPDPVDEPAEQAARMWWEEIPAWCYQLAAGVVAIGVAGVAARVLTPDGSPARLTCALVLLGGGGVALAASHLLAFLVAVFHDAQLGVFDFLLKPLKVWGPTIGQFPKTFKQVASACWGLTAIFFALVVVDGIAWGSLFFGDDKPVAKINLAKAVASSAAKQAKEAEAGDLGEAINDFAGEDGAASAAQKNATPPPPPKPDRTIDCVVLGYEPAGDHDFVYLVLAAEVRGRLQIVSLLSEGFSPEDKADLLVSLREIPRDEPFLPTAVSARWVEPKVAIRVGYRNMTDRNRLRSAEFDQRLVDLVP